MLSKSAIFLHFRLHRTVLDMSTNRLPIGSFLKPAKIIFVPGIFALGSLFQTARIFVCIRIIEISDGTRFPAMETVYFWADFVSVRRAR
jgi:hypothetical protein